MARSKSKSKAGRHAGRESNRFATHRVPLRERQRIQREERAWIESWRRVRDRDQRFVEFDDRRRFHPLREDRPAVRFDSRPVRLEVRSPVYVKRRQLPFVSSPVPVGIGFQAPFNVLICARRRVRRAVMFAKLLAGKRGVGAGKPRRLTEFSFISC